MIDERLIVLLDAYLDSALTAEEKQELERMLLESDAARREFWERASLHGWTYAAAKLNYSARPAGEVARERRQIRGLSCTAILGWLRRWCPRLGGYSPWFGRIWPKFVTVAVACAAAVMLWTRSRPPAPADEEDLATETQTEPAATNAIATLTRGTDVVWENETGGVEVGSLLSPGWLRLKSGAVQIEFYSGARVILEGPAQLELISPSEARLRTGRVSARAPGPAHGFKIYSPEVIITDLGTEFGLDREQSKPVKVEVFEGKVEVAVDGTNRPELLNAGQGVQVNAHHAEPMTAVNRSDFLTAEELARREAVELRDRYQQWKQVDRWVDRDPATLVHLNFEDRRNVDRNLVNRAGGMRASSHAMIFGCNWVDGRWPGKGALQFNRPIDRVRISVPGQFQSLTYLAWVRVDSLPNAWNALALVDTLNSGETHWQLHRNGSMELSVRSQGGKAGWDHLISSPILTRELGQWVQLAAVYDGGSGSMSLYLNGRQVASKSVNWRVPLTLGALELGNWSPTTRRADANYRVRDFHGCMDEFALLSRPLSNDEIHRLYELGKPRGTFMVAGLAPKASSQ